MLKFTASRCPFYVNVNWRVVAFYSLNRSLISVAYRDRDKTHKIDLNVFVSDLSWLHLQWDACICSGWGNYICTLQFISFIFVKSRCITIAISTVCLCQDSEKVSEEKKAICGIFTDLRNVQDATSLVLKWV